MKTERELLTVGRAWRRKLAGRAATPWTGIALSGGGIRSATFSLGVLQALARKNLLKDFDYISSVSGGGYIASSLQWWWSEARRNVEVALGSSFAVPFGFGPTDFPYGPGKIGDGTKEPETSALQYNILSFLRNHGSYLTPGEGINFASLVAVVLRTVLLSLLVWIPLATCLFVGSMLFDENILLPTALPAVKALATSIGLGGDVLAPMSGYLYNGPSTASPTCICTQDAFRIRFFYLLMLAAVVVAAVVFVIFAVVFALLSSAIQDRRFSWRSFIRPVLFLFVAVLLVAWIYWRLSDKNLADFSLTDTLLFVMAMAVIVMTGGRALLAMTSALQELINRRTIDGSYFFRRALERQFGKWIIPFLTVGVIGLIPVLPLYLISHNLAGAQTGHIVASVVSLVSGTVSAVYGYYVRLKKIRPGIAGQIFAPIGAAIFLFGTMTISYVLAVFAFEALAASSSGLINFLGGLEHADQWREFVRTLFVVVIPLAILLGFGANVNHVGLHRFYRDRLMEAFLPDGEAVADGRTLRSPAADRLNIGDLLEIANDNKKRSGAGFAPYPIINTLAFLSDVSDKRIQTRGGDNFIISPLFIGCSETGWRNTSSYCDRYGPLTIASAMAASGAAINSNAGYIGTGVTRSPLVSAVMTILNMRLGIWVGNPFRNGAWLRRIPTYIIPMLSSGLSKYFRSRTSQFVELSDGGNFDNLGVYELVRRKLGVIVVVDGEADSEIALPALVSVATRVEEDFGATILLSALHGPDRLIPIAGKGTYPAGASLSESCFMLGQISYADGSKGVLIYLKATLVKNLDFTTFGYRAEHAEFPHEGTEDQFFSPQQFEAYRNLGFRSALNMIDEAKLGEQLKAI